MSIDGERKFKYAKDWRFVEKYKKDITRGHEIERTVAPYLAEMMGFPANTPYELNGCDKDGQFYNSDESEKITSALDIVFLIENKPVEIQGMYIKFNFCDFKDYKVYRALNRGGTFVQIDTVSKTYAVVSPRWVKDNGKYILHPYWSTNIIKKYAYRIDYLQMPWKPLPAVLSEKVEEIRLKYHCKNRRVFQRIRKLGR